MLADITTRIEAVRYFSWKVAERIDRTDGKDRNRRLQAATRAHLTPTPQDINDSMGERDGSLGRVVIRAFAHMPTVTEVALAWNVNLSDQPIPEPQPKPTLLCLPFAPKDFQPFTGQRR
ncbi:hypothetical protein FEZ60_31580 [Rhodococcus sp. MS16]|uniref:hypothetical protein n=1 Tax=Rhodococcus sp. MS16 TaxID=2579941 RepID=UPI001562BB41|nr:hypothetical protein [Rhodococcus sp. MS16]NRI70048.1 hypothetical protein [Rhodococcus sp. MS16]